MIKVPSDMADALAASALVGAILAVILTLWQPDIDKALTAPKSDDKANRGEAVGLVKAALRTRAWLLFALTGLTFLALAYRAITILSDALTCTPFTCSYEDVRALFLLTEALILVLWVVVLGRVLALKGKLRDLKS
jgi:hypothetical protein